MNLKQETIDKIIRILKLKKNNTDNDPNDNEIIIKLTREIKQQNFKESILLELVHDVESLKNNPDLCDIEFLDEILHILNEKIEEEEEEER